MKKKITLLLLSLSLVLLSFLGFARVFASAPMSDFVDVKLEQQESITDDKIRYISTLELDGATLADIVTIDMELTLSKQGKETLDAYLSLTKVYDSIPGTNGKEKIDDTYYAVHTLTDLSKYYPLWTLSATFKYNYLDGTSENTNTISYKIPMPSSYTHVDAKTPSCANTGNYEYYYDSLNNAYYDS